MKIDSLFINVVLSLVLLFLVKKYWLKGSLSIFVIKPKVASTLSLLAASWLIITAVLYVLSFSYFSYIEVNLALIAEAWRNAQPIYTPLDYPARYSLLYGPWNTVANSLFLVPGPFAIQSSKLMGLANFVMALAALFHAVKRSTGEVKYALSAIGFVCLCWLGFDNYSFVMRPDSFIIAYVICAILSLELWGNSRPRLFFFTAGLLMGLSEGCKAHGFVYFIPLAVFSWESRRATWSWQGLSLSAITAAVVTVLPFLLPNVSVSNYILWLQVSSKHGLSIELATSNTTYFSAFLIFVVLMNFHQKQKWTFWAVIVSSFIAGAFGSLVGAGTHHFMPFFGLLAYFIFTSCRSLPARSQFYLICLILGLSYDAFLSQKALWKYFADWPLQIAQRNDLKTLRASCGPGPVELGYGDNSQMELSYYKPELVSTGDSMILDHSAVMYMNGSGIMIPQSTIDLFRTCAIPYIILPKGEHPWGMQKFRGEVFSANWTEEFSRLFKFERSSQFYSLYRCEKYE